MKKPLLAAAGLALLAASTAGSAAGNPEAGREKSAMCAGCHGLPGYRTAYPSVYSVPKIAGQHPEYIVLALEAYKRGERKHPSMAAIAGGLSAQDMADLAAYYGGK
jgi:cytochrome c553